MRNIFAGQPPSSYAFETRSVRLMGHPTSVRLESKFWVVLEQLADAQDMPMAKFLSALYEEASEVYGEVSNFASLLRCCCINILDPSFDHKLLAMEARDARTKMDSVAAEQAF